MAQLFFALAHRLRCASAILFLPAADSLLFFAGLESTVDAGGRPLRFEVDELVRWFRAC
jgi:hypothetical protein